MYLFIKAVLMYSLLFCVLVTSCNNHEPAVTTMTEEPINEIIIELPEPEFDSDVSIEQSLLNRRSIRTYTGEPISLQELSQLLWSAQGITASGGRRTAPSAGALYPLELYVVAGNIEALTPGIYRYTPQDHNIKLVESGDIRVELADAALSQSWVAEGALSIVMTAVYSRTTIKYGERGFRYVYIEVGHAAQNICLQATAMNLGTVTIGAFHDEEVARLLHLPDGEEPVYILPVGRK